MPNILTEIHRAAMKNNTRSKNTTHLKCEYQLNLITPSHAINSCFFVNFLRKRFACYSSAQIAYTENKQFEKKHAHEH